MSPTREFHKAFGLPAPDAPTVPDIELAQLRKRLIREEFDEVSTDFDKLLAMLRIPNGNPERRIKQMQLLVKELCDLRYVVEGALVAFGVEPDAYNEVHRSNMSKLGPDGRPLYREDGKVLKGPNYSEADPNKMFPSIIEGTVHEED